MGKRTWRQRRANAFLKDFGAKRFFAISSPCKRIFCDSKRTLHFRIIFAIWPRHANVFVLRSGRTRRASRIIFAIWPPNAFVYYDLDPPAQFWDITIPGQRRNAFS